MNIFSYSFWDYGLAFIASPLIFLALVRTATFKTEANKVNTGLSLIRAILLISACIVSSFSFVMFWDKLIGGPVLRCVSIPIALLIAFVIWRIGITLLLAQSGVTVIEAIDTPKIGLITVVGPRAENFDN